FAALQVDDSSDEQVRLGFGPLPANLVLGSRNRSILTIQDDDLTETLTREVNAPPVFADGEQANRSVAEQAAPNTLVGLPVTATDPEGDVLTYGIGGADAAQFSLDSQTGQLRVKGRLDLEVKPSFRLTLSVTDGRGGTDHINVLVNLTNIEEVPVTNRSTQAVGLYAPGKPFYLETPAGAAAISLPQDFSPAPVFVRIESAAANCIGQWPAGDGRAYLTVQFFDTWGNPVEDPNLAKAVATLRFDPQALGGAEAANAAYQRDGIRVYQYRKPEVDWARKQFSLAMDESGGLALTVGGLNGLTCLAAFTHAVAPNQTAPAVSATPEPQGTTRKPRNPTAERDLWYPESTPAPMGVADSGSNGDSPGGGVGGPGGPLGVAQAAGGGDAPWWPRLSLLLGVPLLLGAVGWQVTLFLRERRRRSRTFTRPRSRYFWQ
ncbi:MAG: cadherin repeat domain-containing protein, partial [Chloroflexi bacterium]|nr:cadherin repeat domain-containing protein [Chloroflexota bacterium]